MCGICGFTGEITDRAKIIELMTDLITHRGPDSAGFLLTIMYLWVFAD